MILLLGILLISFSLLRWSLLFFRRYKYIRDHDCQPPPALPQKDPIFGLDVVLHFFRIGKQNRRMKNIEANINIYGKTYSSRVLGRTVIQTIDVQNIQTVFATNSESYEIGNTRGMSMEPLIGRGIFCSEGQRWKQSRALIQPTFTRSEISMDLVKFDFHVEKFLQLLSKQRSTINLGPLFANLVRYRTACL